MSRRGLMALVAWLLQRHPASYRDALGSDVLSTLRIREAEARAAGTWRWTRFAVREVTGVILSLVGEHTRRLRSVPAIAARELHHATRRLRATPSFTVAAAGTLALALGAAIAVFTLLERIVLAPLPYDEGDRLVDLDHAAPGVAIAGDLGMSLGLYQEYAALPSIESAAIYYVGERTLTGRGAAVNAEFLHATPSLARVLRVQPVLGRWFTDAEGAPGGPKSVVLTDGLWRRRFDASPAALGEVLQIDGAPYQIVGVMAPGFAFPDPRAEFILPLAVPSRVNRAAGFNYEGIARLAPGIDVETARGHQNAVIADLPNRFRGDPEIEGGLLGTSKLTSIVEPMKTRVLGGVERILWILLGACAIVMIMAATNLANLLFVRADGRRGEMIVRRALGADGLTMTLYHASEAIVVSSVAAVAGLALAAAGLRAILHGGAVTLPRAHEVQIGFASVAFAIAAAAVAALVLSLSPMLRAWFGGDAADHLRERAPSGGPGARRVRQVLIAAQVGLALVLLASAGLLVRSFLSVTRTDPGFRTENRLVFRIGLPGRAFPQRVDAARWHEGMLRQLRGIPEVVNVATASTLPLTTEGQKDPIEVFGKPASGGTLPVVRFQRVSADYFAALEIPLRAGRLFDRAELDGRADGVVVNESLARLYFPNEDPLGRRIRPIGTTGDRWLTIVGVVADTATLTVQEREPLAKLYVPLSGALWADVPSPHEMTYVLRTQGNPLVVVPSVRDLLHRSNPELAVAGVERFSDVAARSRAGMSFAMVLIALAAAVALVLGVVGIYAVVSYSVTQRRTEIAVRLALGASPSGVTWQQVRQGGRPIVVGGFLGVVAAAVSARGLDALLFGVSPLDPVTHIGALSLVLAVAFVACWWPARRAAHTSPLETLRR